MIALNLLKLIGLKRLLILILAIPCIGFVSLNSTVFSWDRNAPGNYQERCPYPQESAAFDNRSRTSSDRVLLAITILSKVHNTDKRDAIRETWKSACYHSKPDNGCYRQHKVVVKFVIGIQELSKSNLEQLNSENEIHNDLIFLPDLVDTYENLTRKTLKTLQWVNKNLNYSYWFKCDDDSFVLLDRLADDLSKRHSKQGVYWGYFVRNSKPYDSGKWAEHKWFLSDHYLPYAYGGGYILSADVVHRIAVNSDGLQLYQSEDVSVGVWTSPFDIERRHDIRFDTGESSRGCKNDFLVAHNFSPPDMYEKHSLLLNTGGVFCKEEIVLDEYVYNWNTIPSKCCYSSLSSKYHNTNSKASQKRSKTHKNRRKKH